MISCIPKITHYRGENIGLFVLLSRTQAGPSRTVRQEQEEILATTYKPLLSLFKVKILVQGD